MSTLFRFFEVLAQTLHFQIQLTKTQYRNPWHFLHAKTTSVWTTVRWHAAQSPWTLSGILLAITLFPVTIAVWIIVVLEVNLATLSSEEPS